MDRSEYGNFPLREFLGMEVVDVAPGNALAVVEVGDDHLNPNGVAHGGVLFTMIDTAMGKATMTSLEDGQFCASVEIHTRFLRPAGPGRLVADAKVVRPGSKLFHLDAEVRDGNGKLVATGTGTYAVIA